MLKALAVTDGMTDLEGQDWLKLSGDSYRPVRVRLVRDGLVESSGLTRTTQSGKAAVVWAVTKKGQELLEEMKWKQ